MQASLESSPFRGPNIIVMAPQQVHCSLRLDLALHYNLALPFSREQSASDVRLGDIWEEDIYSKKKSTAMQTWMAHFFIMIVSPHQEFFGNPHHF